MLALSSRQPRACCSRDSATNPSSTCVNPSFTVGADASDSRRDEFVRSR